MNVVIVNDFGNVNGGAAQVAISSARGLAEHGCQVYYIFGAGRPAKELAHKNIKQMDLRQYDLLSNPSRINAAVTGLWNASVRRQIRGLLGSLKPNNTVVHIHSWVKSLSVSAINACIQGGVPFVLTLHDYFSSCPNGGFYNYQKQEPCHFRALSHRCFMTNCDSRNYAQKLWRFGRQIITERAGVPRKIKNFIYVSEFSRKLLSDYLPKSASFWHIPNPIDIIQGLPASPGHANVFTFVGRLSPEKGVDLFARAALLSGVKARFVGDGELYGHLKAICPEAEFTGWADRDDVTRYIRESRAVVFPSQLFETQGMVVAEAAALGIPCIVSNACAGRDFVSDGSTGLWFKSGDVISLSASINKLKEFPVLADSFGKTAYERYWANAPTTTNHVEKLLACYSDILSFT